MLFSPQLEDAIVTFYIAFLLLLYPKGRIKARVPYGAVQTPAQGLRAEQNHVPKASAGLREYNVPKNKRKRRKGFSPFHQRTPSALRGR